MAVFLVTLVIILIYGHHRIYTLPAKKMGKAIFLRFGRNILLSRIKEDESFARSLLFCQRIALKGILRKTGREPGNPERGVLCQHGL